MDEVQYDPRYLEGIKFFNECEFFESHEAWEISGPTIWGIR